MDIDTDAPATGAEEFDLHDAVSKAFDTVTAEDKPDAEPAKAEEITDQGSEPEPKPAETQPLEAPSRWSAEDKAKFAALPRDAQEIVLKRESEVDKTLTQKSQAIADQQKRYEGFEQILAPRRQALVNQWGSEQNAVAELFKLSDYAGRDPAGFVKWFAQQHNIDLGQTPQTDNYVDPAVQQVQQQVQGINQQLQTFQQAQITQKIDAFKTERDEAGAVKYPLFDQVQMDMANSLNSGEARDLPSAYALGVLRNSEAVEKLVPDMPFIKDVQSEMTNLLKTGFAKSVKHAYETAIWNNATTRERILEDRKKADDATTLDKAKQAANKAEKAKGITVKSRKDGQAAPIKNANWEDTLAETYDRVVGEN